MGKGEERAWDHIFSHWADWETEKERCLEYWSLLESTHFNLNLRESGDTQPTLELPLSVTLPLMAHSTLQHRPTHSSL